MNASIVSTIRTHVSGGAWAAPQFEQPELLDERDLEPLGTQLGVRIFRHRKSTRYGELRERRGVLTEAQPLPNAALIEQRAADGSRTWRAFDCTPPGEMARIASRPVRVPKAPPPHRPVDSLAHMPMAARRPERAFGSVVGVGILPAEDAARGPAQILARLDRAGVAVRLSTDRIALVVSTSGGHLAPGLLDLVDRAGPLVLAHLRGEPLMCTVGQHEPPAPGISVALGGAPICGECLDGGEK
jgi:hypothetical protein